MAKLVGFKVILGQNFTVESDYSFNSFMKEVDGFVDVTRASGVTRNPIVFNVDNNIDVEGYLKVELIIKARPTTKINHLYRTNNTRPVTITDIKTVIFEFSSAMIDWSTDNLPRTFSAYIVPDSDYKPPTEPEPEPEPTSDVIITQSDLNEMSIKNFEGFVNGVKLVLGSKFNYPFTVVYKTKAGYAFTSFSTPYSSYDPISDDFITNYGILSQNGTVATVNYNTDNPAFKFGSISQYNISVKVYTPPIVYDFVITQQFIDYHNAKNTSVTINDNSVIVGAGFNYPLLIKITARTGYIFEQPYTYYDAVNDIYVYWELTVDNKTQYRTFNSGYNYSSFNITPIEIVELPPTPDLIITSGFITDLADKRVSCLINGVLVKAGDEFIYPYDVKMVTLETHYFTRYDSFNYDVVAGLPYRFNISLDKKTITRNFVSKESLYDYTIETTIDESTLPPEKVAYNDIFVLTPEQARQIATTQYTYYGSVPQGGGTPEKFPQGENIISFIKLPFIIEPELIQGSKTIQIGTLNSGILANYLNIDRYLLDLGNIVVPDDKQNLLSYKNTVAILHLPYTNPINIELEYVLGHTINVTYDINFYDGIASVNISSTKLGGVIDTKSVKLNINIPFGKPDDNPSDNSPRNIDFGISNGVLRPYIELLRNDVILENGFFTIPIIDESILALERGFIKIEEIDLKTNAKRDEKEVILNYINNGVIIK